MANLLDLLKEGLGLTPKKFEEFQRMEQELGANPEVLTGDPGTSPGLAMIPTVKNLGKFKELMQKWMMRTPDVWPEEAKQAWAFMRARHPRLTEDVRFRLSRNLPASGIAEWGGQDVILNPEASKTIGRLPLMDLALKAVNSVVGSKATKKIAEKVFEKTDLTDPLKNVVDTLAHELTHAVDMRRGVKKGLKTGEVITKKLNPETYGRNFGDTVKAKQSMGPLEEEYTFLRDWYFNPWEARARQGGKTAVKSLDKFLDMTGY